MGVQYYVYLGEKRVEGPFDSHKAANRRAAELATNEVGLSYRVKRVADT